MASYYLFGELDIFLNNFVLMKRLFFSFALSLGVLVSAFAGNFQPNENSSLLSPECFEEAEAEANWLMYDWMNSGWLVPVGDPPSDEDMYNAFIEAYDECEANNNYDEFQFGQ